MPTLRTLPVLSALLVVACTAEPGENTQPTAVIRSPSDVASVTEGHGVGLVGVVGDDEQVPESLAVVWTIDGEDVCDGVARPDGVTACTWVAVLDGGAVQLSVTDPDGAIGTASLQLVVQAPNQVPTCVLTEPSDGWEMDPADTVTVRGTVQDDGELRVEFASSLDGSLGEATPDDGGGVELEVGPLSVGVHQLSMTATDPQGETCNVSVGVTVAQDDTAVSPDTNGPVDDTATPARGD